MAATEGVRKKLALVSVYNKEGLTSFSSELEKLGYTIVSTGGTASTLEKEGVSVTKVSDITKFPEILGGRVKTLHPHIHGGILAKRTADHIQELDDLHIDPIDIVVCNLYPFTETVRKAGVSEEEIIEQIDIGGVTLLRAAAKNYRYVLVISDPSDYAPLIEALKNSNGIPQSYRKKLALKAFQHTASYDSAISSWLSSSSSPSFELTDTITLCAEKSQSLRYGENPHQQGALYTWVGESAPFEQKLGKELSYNNILDMESAWNVVRDYSAPCVVIIKHNIPCGLATSEKGIVDAYERAFECDPVSAFGSIIAVNREITLEFVEKVGKLFVEVFISASYSEDALHWLAAHKKNCRVLVARGAALRPPPLVIRSVVGGLLVQSPDEAGVHRPDWKVVTVKQPTPEQMDELAFAWIACKHVKSNAIVFAKGTATIGVGAGQPNRVDSVGLAVKHAGDKAKGCVLASDAFFPFPDGVEAAAQAGVVAIVQPGGSMRDEDVIKVANDLGLVMVFTGQRHFRH